MHKHSSFTLIELLVVVAIIGLLLSIVLVSLNNARMKARDARRISDMRQIRLALEMYYNTYGRYPSISGDTCCDGWDQGPCDGNAFIGALETAGLMSEVSTDPAGGSGTSCYGYNYYRYSAGANGCDFARSLFRSWSARYGNQRQAISFKPWLELSFA